jgi:hypothetical protein
MKRLVSDQNFRSHCFAKRFNVLEILDIVDDFDQRRVYTDSDIQQAFAALRANQSVAALSHFNAILAVDPDNI